MNREDIIRMAREAELHCHVKLTEHGLVIEDLEHFAALVAAAALAEPVCNCDMRTRLVGDGCEVCNPERAQDLAEPVQEPAGYFSVNDYGRWEENENEYGTPLYTAPPQRPAEPVQEPVGYANERDLEQMRRHGGGTLLWGKDQLDDLSGYTPLYSAPPQRKPLTEEEIDALALVNSYLAFARAVERAHGIGGSDE